MIKLKSVEEELADCQKAWTDNPKATFAWCCHHANLIEPLTEPAEVRIQFILSDKSKNEQAVRLRNFRPVRIELPAEYNKVYAEYNKACAEFNKATAEFNKVYAEYDRTYAEFNKVYAEYVKAHAKYDKACAEYDRTYAELNKAHAEWNEELTVLHNRDWPDNSWNGKDIYFDGCLTF